METGLNRIVSGDDWEREIIALLGRRYTPGDFIEVPDTDRGDLGMDGVGRDGVVYQCYSPEEPCTNDERKKKHKAKISADLTKLTEKQKEHKEILGSIIVRRWMLVVPKLTSRDVQSHANEQAERVRQKACDYIASEFEATVSTDAFLSAERQQLVSGVLSRLQISIDEPSEESVSRWADDTESIALVTTLRRKLRMLARITPERLQDMEHKYLHRYLLATGLLEKLKSSYPQIYEAIARTKNAFELRLTARSELCEDRPNVRLESELDDYERNLQKSIAADLDAEHITQIAQGDVTEWLMRCPLSFIEQASA